MASSSSSATPIPPSLATATDRRSRRPVKRRALSPSSAQAASLSTLFARPDQEIRIPTGPPPTAASRYVPPEIVTNVQGSSAGAGSGEFHVYKAARRREYERLRLMDEEDRHVRATETFERDRTDRETKDEERTRKNREKREKTRARKEKARKGRPDQPRPGPAGPEGEDADRVETAADRDMDVDEKAPGAEGGAATDTTAAETGQGTIRPMKELWLSNGPAGITIHDDDD